MRRRVVAATDIHQHLWPEPFLAALARRTEAPRLIRTGRVWALQAQGEPECIVDPRDHDPVRRARRAAADGVERIILAPSCPIGVEALPTEEAAPLLEAYHQGVRSLGAPFGAWAASGLDDPDPRTLAGHLAAGFVGLCLPAGALAVPGDSVRVAALLDLLDVQGAPLLIHPGPSPWAPAAMPPANAPSWWVPLTEYVTQMHRAWFVVNHVVRKTYPSLRICFAMLAGLAPLHTDRLRSRGGTPAVAADGVTFLETSSYGPATVAAVAAAVGEQALVFGTDRPVVGAPPLPAERAGAARENAARLIHGEDGT